MPLAAAAAILTCASLLAIAGQAVAPDATAAASTTTAPTAARTARTVHVPLEILPAPVPTIGAEGAWDPDALPTPSAPREAPETTQGVPRSPASIPTALSEPLVANTDTSTPEPPPATQPEVTTTPSPTSTAAATTTESSATTTEEQPVITTPTATATQTTDIGDVIDQALEDALGETP